MEKRQISEQSLLVAMLLTMTLIITLLPVLVYADNVSGNFFVTEKSFDFTKSIISGKCTGKVPYPILSNDDDELVTEINDVIFDFVESYAICNQGDKSNFSVDFDLPPSGSDDYFSIRWITKKDGKIYHIASLTFNVNNADLLAVDDIFNSLTSTLLSKIIELSDGHLKDGLSWENFLDKIGKRDIQYYIKDKEWYIVFNPTSKLDKLVDIKIPEYFLQGDDVTGSR